MPEESATPDLVELATRVREAVNRRDFDAVESFYAPDAVVHGVEAGTFEGAPAIRRLFEDMAGSYEEFRGEAEELVDLGNGVTFGVFVLTCRPVGSSGEFRFRWASVATWTDSVIEREMRDVDIDEARAAAERLVQERG
jgi:ketosteroid isomerase-like protein